jgi:TATA-box binding protein (TBP) (component of TFIID and TFIIIB)
VCSQCARSCNAHAGIFIHPSRLNRPRVTVKRERSPSPPPPPVAPAPPPPPVIKKEEGPAHFPSAPPPSKRARVVITAVAKDDTVVLKREPSLSDLPTPTPSRHQIRPAAGPVRRQPDQFLPPLAPQGAPFVMMVQNLVFTAKMNTHVLMRHVVAATAHRGAELNTIRFSAVITRVILNVDIASSADLARLGPFAPTPPRLSAVQRRCGERGPLRAPAMDMVRAQDLRAATTRRPRVAKVALLLFHNGKVVCTGARDFSQARIVLSDYVHTLRGIGYPAANLGGMEIRNMVGCAQLSCRIDRERLARELSEYATYDPEQFPGVTIKKHPLTQPVTLLVFYSGRVVVTGTKTKAIADTALARIHPILLHFDVNTPPGTPMPRIVPQDYAPLDRDAPWIAPVATRAAYDALGVDPTASESDIARKWRARMRSVHPDKFAHVAPGTPEYGVLNAETHFVHALYELLSDNQKRTDYNARGVGMPVAPSSRNPQHEEQLRRIIERPAPAAAPPPSQRPPPPPLVPAAAPPPPPLMPDSDDDGDLDAADDFITAETIAETLRCSDDEEDDNYRRTTTTAPQKKRRAPPPPRGT